MPERVTGRVDDDPLVMALLDAMQDSSTLGFKLRGTHCFTEDQSEQMKALLDQLEAVKQMAERMVLQPVLGTPPPSPPSGHFFIKQIAGDGHCLFRALLEAMSVGGAIDGQATLPQVHGLRDRTLAGEIGGEEEMNAFVELTGVRVKVFNVRTMDKAGSLLVRGPEDLDTRRVVYPVYSGTGESDNGHYNVLQHADADGKVTSVFDTSDTRLVEAAEAFMHGLWRKANSSPAAQALRKSAEASRANTSRVGSEMLMLEDAARLCLSWVTRPKHLLPRCLMP